MFGGLNERIEWAVCGPQAILCQSLRYPLHCLSSSCFVLSFALTAFAMFQKVEVSLSAFNLWMEGRRGRRTQKRASARL